LYVYEHERNWHYLYWFMAFALQVENERVNGNVLSGRSAKEMPDVTNRVYRMLKSNLPRGLPPRYHHPLVAYAQLNLDAIDYAARADSTSVSRNYI